MTVQIMSSPFKGTFCKIDHWVFRSSYVETLCWWPTQRPGDETDQSPFAIWWTCWQHFPFLQSNITHHLIFCSIFGLHHLAKEISGPLAAKCSAVFISWWLTLSTLSEFWDEKHCFKRKQASKTLTWATQLGIHFQEIRLTFVNFTISMKLL